MKSIKYQALVTNKKSLFFFLHVDQGELTRERVCKRESSSKTSGAYIAVPANFLIEAPYVPTLSSATSAGITPDEEFTQANCTLIMYVVAAHVSLFRKLP
jgi:hypothetical protein